MGMYNVRVEDITGTSAVIRWETTVTATTEIGLGAYAGEVCTLIDQPKINQPDSTSHSYPISGLLPNQQYCFLAKSFENNNIFDYLPCDDPSCGGSFTTAIPIPPITDLTTGTKRIKEFFYRDGADKDLVNKINEMIINVDSRDLGDVIGVLENDERAREFYYSSGTNKDFVVKLNAISALVAPGLTPLSTRTSEFLYKSGAFSDIVDRVNVLIVIINSL